MSTGFVMRFDRAKVVLALLVPAAVLGMLVGCGTILDDGGSGGAGDVATSGAAGKEPERPNVVVIPTDDLAAWDLTPETLEHMPNIRREFVEGGTTFENAFVTNSVCCPSRATILRGQYAHNHQVLTNAPPLGGAERFRISGGDASTAATWLRGDGYRTSFFGKYLNAYGGTYVPPGWDEWYAVSGNFLSNSLNENGVVIDYDPARYHIDDVLADKASGNGNVGTADGPRALWGPSIARHGRRIRQEIRI